MAARLRSNTAELSPVLLQFNLNTARREKGQTSLRYVKANFDAFFPFLLHSSSGMIIGVACDPLLLFVPGPSSQGYLALRHQRAELTEYT